MSQPHFNDDEGRTWPFTLRISLRERRLLAAAARAEKTSRAEIIRQGLDPLISQLADKFKSDNPLMC